MWITLLTLNLLLGAGLLAVGRWSASIASPRLGAQLDDWEQKLERLPHTKPRGNWRWRRGDELEGLWDGLAVELRLGGGGAGDTYRVRVAARQPVRPGLVSARPGRSPRVPWGDAELGARVELVCEPDLGLVRLSGEARQALLDLVADRWSVHGRPVLAMTHLEEPPELGRATNRFGILARALALPEDPDRVGPLLERARTEPRTSIRLEALRRSRELGASIEQLAAFADDPEEPVRRFVLRASLEAGGELEATDLAFLLRSRDGADQQAALDALGPLRLPEADLLAGLRPDMPPDVGEALITRIAAEGGRASAIALQRLMRAPAVSDLLWPVAKTGLQALLSRTGGFGEEGGLSIAAEQGGALAVVQERGALALAPKDGER